MVNKIKNPIENFKCIDLKKFLIFIINFKISINISYPLTAEVITDIFLILSE